MISNELIHQVNEFALSEVQRYQIPSLFHLEYAKEIGQKLAQELKADQRVVLLGTIFMDCQIGEALEKKILPQHIQMSYDKTREFLEDFPEVTKVEREKILFGVKQHHGAKQFQSLEAEIVCNTDCYRFASIAGVIGGIHEGRRMKVEDLVSLYQQKIEEKWQALSLEICKKELEPQYRAIKEFFRVYRCKNEMLG